MTRNARQVKILEIISENDVETQDDLAQLLKAAGFTATQATISRDIKDLGIIKVSMDGKRQKYMRKVDDHNVSNKLIDMFAYSVSAIHSANNIVVIRTMPNSANIAGMMVDRLANPDVLGCVAGEDTVVVVVRSNEAAGQIAAQLTELLER